jgi:hypothetical protein
VDCEASISACPDLVGAQIEIRKSINYVAHCDNFVNVPVSGIDGCAVLNITKGTCTIYIGLRSTLEARRHERAHCHGYNHTWDPQRRRYEWFPMPEVEMYSLGDRRPISKEAGT